MTTPTQKRAPMNRVAIWNGTVHYANGNGRPLCGAAKRTHSDWMTQTTATVTCKRCVHQCGQDS